MDPLLRIEEQLDTLTASVKWVKREIAAHELKLEAAKDIDEVTAIKRTCDELLQRTRLFQKELNKLSDQYNEELNRTD